MRFDSSALPDEIVRRELDGQPPLGFDCGRDVQNRFLYENAWRDQQEWISTIFLYDVNGVLAAYFTACHDAIPLGTREKPRGIRYTSLGAVKLAQLGVDRRFQGMGLGRLIVADMLDYVRDETAHLRCRYATLDAAPELVGWYAGQGFVVNRVAQRQREDAATGRGDPLRVPVRMRFDLREG